MTQIATVEKILRGGRAEISVPRKSACGHDCESCSGCGMQGSSTHAVALNPIRRSLVLKTVSLKILGIIHDPFNIRDISERGIGARGQSQCIVHGRT